MDDVLSINGIDYVRKDKLQTKVNADTVADHAQRPITERVKTYEDACAVLGLEPANISLDISNQGSAGKSVRAYSKLVVIAKALNEGWKADWADKDQWKYIPWFENNSGSGLSSYDFGRWLAGTVVPARLCYKSKELAEYAGKQFEELYNDYLNS
jgi:hypothetical protein